MASGLIGPPSHEPPPPLRFVRRARGASVACDRSCLWPLWVACAPVDVCARRCASWGGLGVLWMGPGGGGGRSGDAAAAPLSLEIAEQPARPCVWTWWPFWNWNWNWNWWPTSTAHFFERNPWRARRTRPPATARRMASARRRRPTLRAPPAARPQWTLSIQILCGPCDAGEPVHRQVLPATSTATRR